MTAPLIAEALPRLEALADPARAAEALAYHKAPRRYLGIPVPQVEELVAEWRAETTLDDRTALAAALWETDIHEARVAAAKLLTQARIRPDDAVWTLVLSWVPQFDAWALADHACKAIDRRLLADPSRLDTVEGWISHPNMWTRRAALVATLPWTKQNHPGPQDLAIRDRVLGWAASLADDRDSFIQKAIAWWLRDLSKHDPARTRAFLAAHGDRLKPFARAEATRLLPPQD
jgi:3-methyladenine DNA glycosylase AlkD